MDKEQERALIERAKKGDQEAFADVFEALRSKIYGVAYEVVGPTDADDVVMETYLKAWQALPRFRSNSELMTWLYRIARNCSIDYTRKRKRRRESAMPENDEGRPTIEDLPDQKQQAPPDAITANEEQAMVLAAIEKLDENHGLCLRLRYMHELSYKEIAATTGISIGTVMSRLFHAKRKLKSVLQTMDDYQ